MSNISVLRSSLITWLLTQSCREKSYKEHFLFCLYLQSCSSGKALKAFSQNKKHNRIEPSTNPHCYSSIKMRLKDRPGSPFQCTISQEGWALWKHTLVINHETGSIQLKDSSAVSKPVLISRVESSTPFASKAVFRPNQSLWQLVQYCATVWEDTTRCGIIVRSMPG